MQSFVQVQALKQSFPSPSGEGDLVVFDDINFEIAKGDFVCIIGHSGCGKTTILNVLADTYTATKVKFKYIFLHLSSIRQAWLLTLGI